MQVRVVEIKASKFPRRSSTAAGSCRRPRNCAKPPTLSESPASLQPRYVQTLLELGADQNSTVVSPLPVGIITPFLRHPETLQEVVDNPQPTRVTNHAATRYQAHQILSLFNRRQVRRCPW